METVGGLNATPPNKSCSGLEKKNYEAESYLAAFLRIITHNSKLD